MGRKPSDRYEAFFEDLCVTYGWCLRSTERESVAGSHPDDLHGFVDCVIAVYTDQDPALCDRRQRRWVTDLAEKWLFGRQDIGE